MQNSKKTVIGKNVSQSFGKAQDVVRAWQSGVWSAPVRTEIKQEYAADIGMCYEKLLSGAKPKMLDALSTLHEGLGVGAFAETGVGGAFNYVKLAGRNKTIDRARSAEGKCLHYGSTLGEESENSDLNTVEEALQNVADCEQANLNYKAIESLSKYAREEVQKLSPKDQQMVAIAVANQNGYSQSQLAKIENISNATIMRRCRRGVEILTAIVGVNKLQACSSSSNSFSEPIEVFREVCGLLDPISV